MKKVFNSSQLTHVWANQGQSEGRSNNMFFEGTDICKHYLAARIYTIKGKKFALVNNHNYSMTTAKHLSLIRSSLYQLMPFFSVSDVTDLKGAVKFLDNQAKDAITLILKKTKVISQINIDNLFSLIVDKYKTTNKLRKILGYKPIKLSEKDQERVFDHLNNRLTRYQELNTPEMIEKKKIDKEKQTIKKNAKIQEKLNEAVTLFRSTGTIRDTLKQLPYELLRINNNNIIKTSRGAEVPLMEARKLLSLILSGKGNEVIGANIGNGFTIRSIDDTKIVIGCHTILLEEAKNVLKGDINE